MLLLINFGWTAMAKILTVVYHLPKKSRNFKWHVNRKINFVFPKGNFLEEKGIFWKVDQTSQMEFASGNSMFHLLWDNLCRNRCIPVATNWNRPFHLTSDGNFRNFCYNGAGNLQSARCSLSVFCNALAAWKTNLITARDRIKKTKRATRMLLNVLRDMEGWKFHTSKNSVYNINIYLFVLDIIKWLWQ